MEDLFGGYVDLRKFSQYEREEYFKTIKMDQELQEQYEEMFERDD